jgi:hypothetical protein
LRRGEGEEKDAQEAKEGLIVETGAESRRFRASFASARR